MKKELDFIPPKSWVPGTPPLVKLMGISKYFPGVIANEAIEIDIWPGEIHALVGENGAGKSTLMNILTGLYQPDRGEIIIDGYGQVFTSPQDAIHHGIGMVHQHFKLVEAFSVADNIHLAWEQTPFFLSRKAMIKRTAQLAEKYKFPVNPTAQVKNLSAGEQQRVEILRVLSRNARVLILDEPTAVLTAQETEDLFFALRTLREQGKAVVVISHKLNEVMTLCDRVSVLRNGRKIATHLTEDCNEKMLATLMVGHEVARPVRQEITAVEIKSNNPVLSFKNVSVGGQVPLDACSFDIYAGEILGIAGVIGNGQKELSELASGMIAPCSGEVEIEGRRITQFTPDGFAAAGIGHIPEDRLHTALALELSVVDNLMVRKYRLSPIGYGIVYNPKEAFKQAQAFIKAAHVALKDSFTRIGNLSGGNQQRLIAQREIAQARKLLVAAYPNRGLDIKAIEDMQHLIRGLRDQGVAILLFSEDIDELLALSDRVGVLFHGKLMGIQPASQLSREALGLMMGGQAMSDAEHVKVSSVHTTVMEAHL
ncbi:ABC transporter ATP-binding protein [Entomobacter blattae]|uniref:Galactose/methyl galactoside import ATP-binding protein MglA n=1 Tax=Entomobacter blattae TaxID=2762277 RepID=A0A7H1NU83_9PROT|nr:ABC transporter ATP-binding protein [Entomobacter blattae]QNT79343.1 Galactose/methyl galactoside import ATP-binding protein MglA [Entomobacter blattae]